ncbi:MAG TPA: hypothetical protein PKM41_04445 [Deltaproteobacteria bacterium]|jgi:hypothetical protein|nr:hypothetical protein [Deltaproteobacteria bacterium]HOI05593.1 hypothetical protein [Deltaproteobacteria bacterium]
MDTVQRSTQTGKWPNREGERGPFPVTAREYFILSRRGINYYLVDLRGADHEELSTIISQCEYVEGQCWRPQENFSDYLRKCDLLCYAEKDGSIVGFTAVTMMFSGRTCLYSNDETMVLKQVRNQKVALSLVSLALQWAFVKTGLFNDTRSVVFTSISSNPRVVNFYFKNSWSRIFFDCSFKPSLRLIAIKNEYCRKHRIELVHEDYPFCMKNLFPGSNTFDRDNPKFQFSGSVKANMPEEFDHMDRGDAFAFMLKVPMAASRLVVSILMARCFGREYLASRLIGPFREGRRTQDKVRRMRPLMRSPVSLAAWRTRAPLGDALSRALARTGARHSSDSE